MGLGDQIAAAPLPQQKSKVNPWGLEVWCRAVPTSLVMERDDKVERGEEDPDFLYRFVATGLCDEQGNAAWDDVEDGIATLKNKDLKTVLALSDEIAELSGTGESAGTDEPPLPDLSTSDTSLPPSSAALSENSQAA